MNIVMPGEVPGTNEFAFRAWLDVDGWDKPGHDEVLS